MNRITAIACRMRRWVCFAAPLALMLNAHVSAAPVISESFDYPGGGASLAGANGGTGWKASDPWAVGNPTELTGGVTVEDGSLTLGSYPTSGNRIRVTATASTAPATNLYITAHRQVAVTVGSVGGEMWQSFLWKRIDDSFNGINYDYQVGDGLQDEIRVTPNFELRIRPKRQNLDGPQLRYFDHSLGEELENPLISDGDTFLFVARFQDLGNTDPITGPQRMAQLWILDAAGYEAVKAGSTLYAEAVQINNALHGSDDETMLNADDTITIQHLYKDLAAALGNPFTTEWDELRWGDTIDDVLPGFTNTNIGVPIPEPSSCLLAIVSVLSMLGNRRRVA